MMKLKFQVTIEVSRGKWEISPKVYDNYDEAQAWRRKREAEILRDNQNKHNVNSNLIVIREIAKGVVV